MVPDASTWSLHVLSSITSTEKEILTFSARSSATRFSLILRSAMSSVSIFDHLPRTSYVSHFAQRNCCILSGSFESSVRCLRHASHILSEVRGGGAPQAMQNAPSDMVLAELRLDASFQGFP